METTHVVVFSELSPRTKVQYTRFLLDHDIKVLLLVYVSFMLQLLRLTCIFICMCLTTVCKARQ